jgi:hypothetical protein
MRKENGPTSGSFEVGAAREQGDVPVGTVVVPLADVIPSDIVDAQDAHAHPDDSPLTSAHSAETNVPERIWHWTVTVEGTCMRDTTTATDRRRDALLSATRFVEAAKRIVRSEPGRVNGTIAHAIRQDGLPNGSDGQFVLHLVLRDADPASIGRVYERIAAEAWTIGRLSQTRLIMTPHESNPSVLYDIRDQSVTVAPPVFSLTGQRPAAPPVEEALSERQGLRIG